MDTIYTPHDLAHTMVSSSRSVAGLGWGATIADFAAGRGELLNVAELRWPDARIVAVDVDPIAVSDVQHSHPGWLAEVGDFLGTSFREHIKAVHGIGAGLDLILLNPPFSCRGGTRFAASIGDASITCSLGMAFFINAVDLLRVGGEIITILPVGCLMAERDASGWDLLRELGSAEVVKTNHRRTFPPATITTAVLRFVKLHRHRQIPGDSNIPAKPTTDMNRGGVTIVRGTTPMYAIERVPEAPSAFRLVHTTDIQSSRIQSYSWVKERKGRMVEGPVVLLPRVGNPTRGKLARYLESECLLLSDCIIALQPHARETTLQLWQHLYEHWSSLEPAYGGSGARYLTVARLATFLKSLGYSPVVRQ